jgi:hypothetical protein
MICSTTLGSQVTIPDTHGQSTASYINGELQIERKNDKIASHDEEATVASMRRPAGEECLVHESGVAVAYSAHRRATPATT